MKSLWSCLKFLLIFVLQLGFGFENSLPRGHFFRKSPWYRSFDRSANWRVRDSIRTTYGSLYTFCPFRVTLKSGRFVSPSFQSRFYFTGALAEYNEKNYGCWWADRLRHQIDIGDVQWEYICLPWLYFNNKYFNVEKSSEIQFFVFSQKKCSLAWSKSAISLSKVVTIGGRFKNCVISDFREMTVKLLGRVMHILHRVHAYFKIIQTVEKIIISKRCLKTVIGYDFIL